MNQPVRKLPPPDFIQAAVQQTSVVTPLTSTEEERKRTFLRMASHELRTPLNSILGFSEIIESEMFGPLGAPQYKEYAAIIHASGARMLRLVNQILEIARLEAQAVSLNPRAEPLDSALRDVLESLKGEISARKITVTVLEPEYLPSVTADPRGLRTVLTNLIQNAACFSPEGGEVRVSADTVGRGVEIMIEDDGPGIDREELPRLMKPFEQGENVLTRHTEGAGLGLSICDLLCRAMSGRLTLQSQPGRGVTARVKLPSA